MKRCRQILAMAVVVCMMFLTACSPILKSFDPNNVQLSYRVPEKREQEIPKMEIETQALQIIAQTDRDKYDAVDGTDAYYLLPTGTPLPTGLVDFQSLGFLDDKTTCYAYQALYDLKDESGLGGMPEQGLAGPVENVDRSENAVHQMVTILMKYNTETKKYKVLYHKIEEVVVSYVEVEDEKGTTGDTEAAGTVGTTDAASSEEARSRAKTKRLRVSKASELPTGKKATDALTSKEIEALPVCEKIYTQILRNGVFLFYHDGYGHTFSNKGEEDTVHCLRNYLERITYLYGPNGYYSKYADQDLKGSNRPWERSGDVYTISDITVDENGYFYIRLCMTKKEINIRGGIDISQMPDPEKDMTQIYCRVFCVDVGQNSASGDKKNSDQTDNYFVSENQNYQNTVEKWMSVNNKVIPFGEGKPSEEQIAEEVKTADALKKEFPDTFGVFTFNKTSLDVNLYFGKMEKEEGGTKATGIPMDPERLRMYLHILDKNKISAKNAMNNTFFLGAPSEEKQDGKKSGTIGSVGINAFAFETNVWPTMPTAVQDKLERTFTIEYTETETDSEGNEKHVTRTEERKETAFFVKEMRTSFPKGTNVLFSKETEDDCSIAPSSRNGVIGYKQKQYEVKDGKLNVTETDINWTENTGEFNWLENVPEELRKMIVVTVPDRAKKILMLEPSSTGTESSSPLLFMTGENGIYYGNLNKKTPKGTVMMEAILGIPYEEMVESTESLGSDVYYDPVRAEYLVKDQKNWLYLASPTEGILKINLALGDSKNSLSTTAKKAGRVSRIYPYPCFGIHMDESGDAFRVIAFQNDQYSYEDIDQFRAKVYRVPLDDAQAQLNQMSFVFDLNDDLKKQMINEMLGETDQSAQSDGFTHTLENMGIQNQSADHVKSYRSYLRNIVNRKIEARRQIGRISGVMNENTENTFPRYAFEQYSTILKELKTNQDVEKFLLLMKIAKNTFEGVSQNKQELVNGLKNEIAGTTLADQSAESVAAQISKFIWPDFTNKNFEESDDKIKNLQNSSMNLKDINFAGMNCTEEQQQKIRKSKETASYLWIYRNLSKNREEVEKIAAYISADQAIQERILNGDKEVWNEVYMDCGISRTEIEERGKTENPKLVSAIDYEEFIKERAGEWRSGREFLLTLQDMGDQATEKSAFFSRLLNKDLAMQEKECRTGTAVESLILSLCRAWSENEEVSKKSDYDLIKFLQEKNGYSQRIWKREMEEIADDLNMDCSITGYSNRGNYLVRKMADRMEDDNYEAQENRSVIKNPGQLVLESMKDAENQSPWTSDAWKIQLVNAGIEADSTDSRLKSYSLYLKKEVQDREKVKTELETLSGVKVTEDKNLEEQYDSCKTVDDIEVLLAGLYVERPEIKQYYTGEQESQAESQPQETKTSMTIDEMVERMRTQSGLTRDQWTKKMETLLDQMEVKLGASDFLEYEEKLKEKKNQEFIVEMRQKRVREKAYQFAKNLAGRDLSFQAFRKTLDEDPRRSIYPNLEQEINRLGEIIQRDEGNWENLTGSDFIKNQIWIHYYIMVEDKGNSTYLKAGLSPYPKALGEYQKFCEQQVSEWLREKKQLFEIMGVSEADIKDKDAFYNQIIEKVEGRKN